MKKAKKADSYDVGCIYRTIKEFPDITAEDISMDTGYDDDIVQDAIYGLIVSGVIVDKEGYGDGHLTAAIIRKNR